ncbi:hypothetical protein [Kineococcus sp. R86509]|uniref:hypothetical protein n=1 Tax=Kineococcus sp. R86509 TaxID=3093851 RepID=UPI0036D43C7A
MNRNGLHAARHALATTFSTTLARVAAYYGFALTKLPEVREAIVLDHQELGDAPHLQCPHCESLDTLAEIDLSERCNQIGELDYGLDGRSEDLFAFVAEDDHNYRSDHYECTDCGGHVTIPHRVEISWG